MRDLTSVVISLPVRHCDVLAFAEVVK